MGYNGKLEEKFLAQSLRKQGLSYKEILKSVSVSKDTISRWCKEIPLTESQKVCLINNKKDGQKKGSLVAAENKRQARIERTQRIKIKAGKEIGDLSGRESFIAGIALYAAEGNKMDGKGGFANTDPKLIKFMVRWFIEYAKLPVERIRGAIWIHEDLNEQSAKKFWSQTTGIPESQFHKTYIVQNSKKKIKKNIHQYGVFTIRFSDSEIHRKIMGWIYATFDDKISTYSAIAQR